MKKNHGLNTKMLHGQEAWPENNPLIMPPYLTSTYTDSSEGLADAFLGRNKHQIYSRCGNPNTNLLASQICALDGGAATVILPSGMAAVSATAITLAKVFFKIKTSPNLVSASTVYSGTHACFKETLPLLCGINTSFIPAEERHHLEYVAGLIQESTFGLWIESPGNPTLGLVDIKKYADLAHAHGIPLIVDNTFSSFIQKPFDLGADIIVYSTTKYINGHGTSVGGAVTVNKKYLALAEQIHQHCIMHLGMAAHPMGSWLTSQGIGTHNLRMARHSANALEISQKLEGHKKIKRVFYPFLKNHPDYELARRQMAAGGGMISFELKGGKKTGRKFINNLELIKNCVSLGDTKSIIQQPACGTHSHLSLEDLKRAGISPALIRLSVGLENWEDVYSDLEQALKKI